MSTERPVDLCVIGLGYIGLPTATAFANAGLRVHGVDVRPDVISSINEGRPHIVEPGLDAVLEGAVRTGNLAASLSPVPAETFIIAVPTPFKGDHEPDLSYVESAVQVLAPLLKADDLVILESTSPVGTTELVARLIAEARPDLGVAGLDTRERGSVYVAHCPERVLPGRILIELVENDRVIGGVEEEAARRAAQLYRCFVRGKIHVTDARAAEMSKLTENAFRDVNIAFANELSLICERLGVNVWEVIRLANLHPRVNILQPGPGVGGHCIAVDPWFIVHSAPEEARLVRMARDINDGRPEWVVDKVLDAVSGIDNPTIACLGLAYKADVDDLRESPSVEVVEQLVQRSSGRVLAVEPFTSHLPKQLDGRVELAETKSAVRDAHAVVLLVDHTPFRNLTVDDLAGKVVIDTRGFWRPKAAA